MFYGLPIHIMRDLFMTARSFLKRLTAFLRYRRATSDMNQKYEDATVEDIEREDTCIICREEMRPWSVTNPQAPPVAPGALPPARAAATVNERTRPKKLPCGHILHLGCLKSWLERQQVCPTCRRPVVDGPPNPAAGGGAANNANVANQAPQRPMPGQQDGAGPQAPARAPRGMRMLNFGPLRVGFGQANLQDLQNMGAAQAGQENVGGPRVYGLEVGFPRRLQPQPQAPNNVTTVDAAAMPGHLQQIEQQIVAEIRSLQVTQQELQLVQLLQAELARLRLIQNGGVDPLAANFQMPQMPQLGSFSARNASPLPTSLPQTQRHGARPNTAAIPAGSADLPPGVTIPEGWSLLPLQRLDSVSGIPQTGNVSGLTANSGLAPTATTQPIVSPIINGSSNNTSTPSRTLNPDNQSQASSVDSSDTNAIHTPPSVIADQSNPAVPSNTVPSTTLRSTPLASTMQGESSALPDWGSSQLFSSSGRESITNNTSSLPAHPVHHDAGGEASTSTRPANNTHFNPAPTDEEKDGRGGKAKAKTVTIEDAEDDSEGS